MLKHEDAEPPKIVKLLEVIDTEETCRLEAHSRLTEGEARGAFCQLVSALQPCHQRGVVHPDMKLSNLLFDAKNNVRISDFGLSNQWHPGKKLDTFCSSHMFEAPEELRHVGSAVDVWSLGVILYIMVTGSLPFRGRDFWELGQCMFRGQYQVPEYLSDKSQI